MQLEPGKIAVVTGGGSGIGLALAERFARNGLHVVLADVDETALAAAAERITAHGVEALTVPTDVSDEAAVNALAAATVERFDAAHIVCNNAGVVTAADPWFGPLSAWNWVMGVNLWGVIYGVRAFLPILVGQGEGHIVNTSSMAGLMPGMSPSYDATKHAVVALSEDLYGTVRQMGLNIGVSVLCPGWVQTGIVQADRNWPDELGEAPPMGLGADVIFGHVARARWQRGRHPRSSPTSWPTRSPKTASGCSRIRSSWTSRCAAGTTSRKASTRASSKTRPVCRRSTRCGPRSPRSSSN